MSVSPSSTAMSVAGMPSYLVITTSSSAPANGQQATASGGGSVLVSLIYFVIFWSWIGGGRTLGMRFFKLRVVRERDWAPLSVWNSVVRWIGLWVSFAFCFVGVIWVAFDPRHQGWHDKIARTLVVYA